MFGEGELRRENAGLTAQVADLTGKLATYEAIGGPNDIAATVQRRLDALLESGQALQDALPMAQAEVAAEESDKLVKATRDKLLRDKGDELRAEYRRTEGPQVRERLDEQFGQDGTYASLRQQVAEEQEGKIRAGLLAEKKAEIAQELNTPAAQAAATERLAAGLVDSTELADFRATTQAELNEQWRQEAIDDAKRRIREEEEGREVEFKEGAARNYRDSYDGQDLRRDVKAQLEREWHTRTHEDVAAAVQDEELAALLAKKAKLAKEELTRENRAKELLMQFEGGGIDLSTIEQGVRIVLCLGSTHEDYTRSTNKTTISYERTIDVLTVGDGRVQVVTDSFDADQDKWKQSLAIQPGTVIAIGTLRSENSQNTLVPRLLADVKLNYDDDTTTPTSFIAMPVKLTNIKINGVFARTTKN